MSIGRYKTIVYGVLLLASISVRATETLVISVVENAPQTNVVIPLLKRAYSQLGIQIEVQVLSGTRALKLSNNGTIDGEAFRIADIDKMYPNLVRVNVPVYTKPLYVYVKEGKEFPVKGWESIPRSYVIGYQSGVVLIEKALDKYHLDGEKSADLSTMLRKLDAGRIDVIITYRERMQLVRQLDLDEIVMLEPEFMDLSLYHYVHKKHAHIVPELTKVLTEMLATSELAENQQEMRDE